MRTDNICLVKPQPAKALQKAKRLAQLSADTKLGMLLLSTAHGRQASVAAQAAALSLCHPRGEEGPGRHPFPLSEDGQPPLASLLCVVRPREHSGRSHFTAVRPHLLWEGRMLASFRQVTVGARVSMIYPRVRGGGGCTSGLLWPSWTMAP